jgi:branched-chain amino acid transport system substrate-binding protein
MQGSTMKPRLIVWPAVVAGVVLVLAVAWAAILWTRPEPIRIAFANSLSGPSALAGTESLVATQLAIDEVNAKGGVNGRPIELVLFDDASNPAVARANAQAIRRQPVGRGARSLPQLRLACSRADI